MPEVPNSLVPESKLRDSRFKSRLGIGLKIEFKAWEESESVSEPKLRYYQSWNQNRNWKLNLHRLFTEFLLLFHWKYDIFVIKELFSTGIGIEIPRFSFWESESVSESESSYRNVQYRNRTRNLVLDIASLRTGIGTGFQDWTVSVPELESKKLKPGISGQCLL